ncbi:hypothetical protein [Reinekea sp.]|jgi:hypothetical protein|uniref:hypothetical protein n=1 Tax=Reinekea sp. TaxID=1970455 RepID=UPI002A835C1D|nr:hypothetical protein [Reinekea sp.]
MFHFSRRTLWIIIYVTIPLIILLDSLGPDPLDEADSEPLLPTWSLDELAYNCDRQVCALTLAGAERIWLSAIVERIPTGQVAVPEAVHLQTQQLGGRFVIGLEGPADAQTQADLVAFLQQWLPSEGDLEWVVSGAVSSELVGQLNDLDFQRTGIGLTNSVAPIKVLTRLQAPPLGTADQLAFLLWIDLLRTRLAAYPIKGQWDHRPAISSVGFNGTLSADLFYPVDRAEFAPVLAAYQSSATQRQRSAAQIQRYAVTAALYRLPLSFFVNQPERLATLSLASVNQMREFALGQITAPLR